MRVTHAGLNPADLSQREGSYPAPPGSPRDVPGLEVSGTVEACGAQVLGWKPGDRVFGLVGGGGLADRVVVHQRCVAAVPDALDEAGAAAVPEAFITAHDAIRSQSGLTHRRDAARARRGGRRRQRRGADRRGLRRARARHACAARTPPRSCASSAASRSTTPASPTPCWRRPAGAARTSCSSSSARRTSPTTCARSPCRAGSSIVGLGAGAEVSLVLRQLMARRVSLRGTMLRARPLEQKAQARARVRARARCRTSRAGACAR